MHNTLYYGDNLNVLRRYIPDESVDLIYLDPPFNSNRNYNVLFKDEQGKEADSQILAFEDTWHWNDATEAAYHEITTQIGGAVGTTLEAMLKFIGPSQMMAYLVMMTARLVELHRVMKSTGSLYLHCDPTASHYLKVVLDTIFGTERFQNEIVWQRTNAHNMQSKGWVRANDIIFFYTKSNKYTFNIQYTDYGEQQLKRFKLDEYGRYYKAENLTFSNPNPNRQFEWRGTKPPLHRSWGATEEQLERWYQEGRILLKRDGTPRLDGLKIYLDETKGKPITSNWTDIERITNTAAERLGYPTQKPLALLERIINASSNPGDVVLDPFCGCGTAVTAAHKLGRSWIGIDITALAISLQRYRLNDMFPGIEITVKGLPKSVKDAETLAESKPNGRYQFQWWALSLIKARPLGGQEKKGRDRGIDGVVNFVDDATGKLKQALVQVKSGGVKSGDVRDLRGTVEREGAAMGIFITLEPSSSEMRLEATRAGMYHSDGWGRDYNKIQILTIKDLLAGVEVKMPPAHGTFKEARRVEAEGAEQEWLW